MTDPWQPMHQPQPGPRPRTRHNALVVAAVVGLVAVLAGGGVAVARIGRDASPPAAAPAVGPAPSMRTIPPTPRATAPSRAPSAAPASQSLRGAHLVVGSKDFDEQLVLGQIARLVLQHAGATVTDSTGLSSTTEARQALLDGSIDLYWEYTGTGWIVHLKHTEPISDESAQFRATAAEDLRENGVRWLSPYATGNNTYAIAVRSGAAASLGVHNVSDLQRLARTNPSALTFCVESEFATRDDGLPGMQRAYGFSIPARNIHTMDTGAVYPATAEGRSCNFGEVFTTDGRVLELGLTRLADDRHWFPNYNPAITMRSATYAKYPQIEKLLAPVARALDTNTLTRLNYQVSGQGQDPRSVARAWLVSRGFLS